MSFTTAEDFNLVPYSIPNADNSSFQLFIDKQEKNILVEVLGVSFTNELYDYVSSLPALWLVDTEFTIGNQTFYGGHVWQSLTVNTETVPIEGADWTMIADTDWLKFINGEDYTYKNVLYNWCGLKVLLIPYIFYLWLRGDYKSYTSHGIAYPKVENATVVNPSDLLVEAYDDFIDKLDGNSSMLGYLYVSETLPEFVFNECIDRMNEFDL